MDEKDNILEGIAEEAKEASENAREALAEAENEVAKASDAISEAEAEAAEAVQEAEKEVEEASQTIADAAEEVKEAAGEAEAAAEKAEEAAKEVKETAQKAVDEIKETAAAKKNDIVIKKKRGLSTTNIILIIVIAVMALAIAAYVLYKEGVFKKWFPVQDRMTMEDYSTIEVDRTLVEIDDDTVDGDIDTFVDSLSTKEEVTEGTVEDGDTVYIAYVGTVDGVAFDGGTSEGTDLVIGSGSYIDDFEEQLIGHKIGETGIEVNVTFPEDYGNEELNGKDAVFTVDILHKDVTNIPELTDELVKENSEDYYGEQIDSIDALKTYIKENTEHNNLQRAMLEALQDKQTIISYNEERLSTFHSNALETLSMYASMYGMDSNTLAGYYGFDDAESYAKDQSEYYCGLMMLFEKIAADKGITVTDEELDASIQEYMENNGYSDTYSLEEFKETNGKAWVDQYRTLQLLSDKVLEALEPNVVLVDPAPEETETTAAAE